MKLIIGLVGEKGSGKGTFAKKLKELAENEGIKLGHHRFSDILRETLDLWGISKTRSNLQQLAIVMNQAYGDGTLANAIYQRTLKSDLDVTVLDGVRWEADIQILRRFNQNLLVYITTDSKTRYQRTIERGENDQETKTSYEQFLKEELVSTELLISTIGSLADIRIENTSSLEDFYRDIIDFYNQRVKNCL